MWYFGLIALVMYPGSETALALPRANFTPLLDALLVLSQTPHQTIPLHIHITYTMMMTSIYVIAQQNCSDIMCISSDLNLKFEC